MKKLLKSIIVFITAVSISSATPTDATPTTSPESFKVGMYNVQNSFVIRVFVEKIAGETVKVELKDKYGSILLSKSVSKKDTKQCLNIDMSNLPSENYLLEFSNGKEIMVKKLNLKQGEKVVVDKKILF